MPAHVPDWQLSWALQHAPRTAELGLMHTPAGATQRLQERPGSQLPHWLHGWPNPPVDFPHASAASPNSAASERRRIIHSSLWMHLHTAPPGGVCRSLRVIASAPLASNRGVAP